MASMTSLLSSQLFFVFSLLSFSEASPLPPLLSLNCTPPSHKTLIYNKSIQALLDNLTYEVTKNRFITSAISLGQDRFNGLMQCRLNLTPTTCTLCAQNAKHTISNLCPNSESVTAWFDGCYLQYYHNYGQLSSAHLQTTNMSCSNQTNVVDLVQFEPALETLLLRLRAEINLATHHRFSSGELKYGNGSRVLYGLAECVRFLRPTECEVCVGEGIKKLHEYCGGRNGGTVVNGYCTVRFESYRFLLYNKTDGSDSGSGSDSGDGSGAVSNWERGNGGCMGFKVKVALAWGVVVACIVGVVFSAWLLRRSIINRAKVVTSSGADDEMGDKGIV